MRVLVTGAGGFIGSQIIAALASHGHDIVRCIRDSSKNTPSAEAVINCNFQRDTSPEVWLPRLASIDAVINCAGILREVGENTFSRIHIEAPIALYQACMQAGVRKVIQISALGHAEDGEFIRSKHKGDEYLATCDLDWTILRPSVVYSTRGSYGGTSLLRAMAALPGVLCLPGKGTQSLQPIHGEDLGQAVAQLLETDKGHQQIIEAVGPKKVTIKDYLLLLRQWLQLSKPWMIRIPLMLVKPFAWLGELFGKGPLGLTMFRMLEHGNVGNTGAVDRFTFITGIQPRAMEDTFARDPSFVQDRWHAQLYFLGPLLRITLGILWILSGLVGFILPLDEARTLLTSAGITESFVAPVVYGASMIDLILGCMLLLRWHIPIAGILMLVSLLAYTFFIGVTLPSAWLEPFGGLIKNLPLIPAVLIMMVLEKRR